MTRFNQILAALLVVQIAVAVGIYIEHQQPTSNQPQTTLLSVDKNQIDRITLDAGDGKKSALLHKVNGQWQLPNHHQLPADNNRINALLTNLSTTPRGWPVTATAASQERFEVSDNHFKTRVTLARGEEPLQTLYLGTSPGFRQLHLRRANEEEVYAVKLNSFEFTPEDSYWLDKTVLQPQGAITALQGPDFTLTKESEAWQLKPNEGELLKEAADKLATTIAGLSLQSGVDQTIDKPAYELTVKTASESYTYRFFADKENYYVNRNGFTTTFKISKSDYDQITTTKRAQLIKQAASATPAAAVPAADPATAAPNFTAPPASIPTEDAPPSTAVAPPEVPVTAPPVEATPATTPEQQGVEPQKKAE